MALVQRLISVAGFTNLVDMEDKEADGESSENEEQPFEDELAELTPEQREALRRTMENLRRTAFPRIASNLTGFQSVIRSMQASSALADAQRALVASSLEPMLDSINVWQKQMNVINTDLLRSSFLAQNQLNAISAQLTKNIDFGPTGAFSRMAKVFADQQATWLKNGGGSAGPVLDPAVGHDRDGSKYRDDDDHDEQLHDREAAPRVQC